MKYSFGGMNMGPTIPKEPIKANPEPEENPWIVRIMNLPDRLAMELCHQFGVPPLDTKQDTAKATVKRVCSWGIDEVKQTFLEHLERYEKLSNPNMSSVGTPKQETLIDAMKMMVVRFGIKLPPTLKFKVEMEIETLSVCKKQLQQHLTEILGPVTRNIKITEIK